MNSTKNGTSARAVVAQRFGMATMYLAAAALVSWSAMAAKRSQGVPALAAIDAADLAEAPQGHDAHRAIGNRTGSLERREVRHATQSR